MTIPEGNEELLQKLAEIEPSVINGEFDVRCFFCGCDLWPGHEQPHFDSCVWQAACDEVGKA